MDFLIYILIGWGITDFLVNGSILDKIRTYFLVKAPMLAKLFSCIRCSGFWVGVLMGTIPLLDFGPSLLREYGKFWGLQIVASGFLISGSAVIINSLLFFFYSNRPAENKINLLDEE